MPNTYTQLYIHFVFAVKYRMAVIQTEWKMICIATLQVSSKTMAISYWR